MQPVESYMQEALRRHNVLIPKDDPIWLLHTFLELYLEDLQRHQTQGHQILVSQLEEILTRWDDTATQKANRVMGNSLTTAQEDAANQYQVVTNEFKAAMQSWFTERDEVAQKRLRTVDNFVVLNLISAGLVAVAGMFVFLR